MAAVEQKLVNQIFQDIALLLGGAVALHRHEISDELVWGLSKDIKKLYSRYLQKTNGKKHGVDLTPHPAIADLIAKIRLSQQ